MATKKAKQPYQYEPLVTPSSWRDDEQRFSIRLTQIIDDLYQKYSGLRQKVKDVGTTEPSDEPVDAATLNGKTADDFLAVDGTAVNADKLGGKSPKYYLPAYNLLDNSYFVKPVGQAGLGDGVYHGSAIYPADRWREWTPGTTHHFDPITGLTTSENCTFAQVVEVQLNKPYTIALGFSDGTVLVANGVLSAESSISIGDSKGTVSLYVAGGVTYFVIGFCVSCIWAALYEGEYTAETLPPYVPKGYAAELLECQRYFVAFHTYGDYGLPFGSGSMFSTNTWRITVPLPVPMRAKPTFGATNLAASGVIVHVGGAKFDNVNPTVLYQSGSKVILQANISGQATKYAPCELCFSGRTGTPGYIYLSADL